MIEMLFCGGSPIAGPTGPGSDTLIGEYTRPDGKHTGYYGRVSQADLITYSALFTDVKPGGTALANTDSPWLKFTIDGKIVFIAAYPLGYSMTWDGLNSRGVVYGSRTIMIKSKTYKIRLLSGLGVSPGTTAQTVNSEWNRMMYNICASAAAGQEGDKWDNLTLGELGINQGNGSLSMTSSVNSADTRQIVMRGFNTITNTGTVFKNQSSNYQYMGWRPVLELVPA